MAIKPIVLVPSVVIAGGVPVGSYFVYQYVKSDSSLMSRLKFELKDSSHKKILKTGDEEWTKWSVVYEKDTKSQISGVSAKEIPNWCDTQLRGSDSKSYKNVLKWCVINTRSLKREAEANQRSLISTEENNVDAWQSAWEYYSQNKTGMEIKITDVNGTGKQDGGPKLKNWCRGILGRKMYEYIEEVSAYDKVAKWCAANR